MAPRFLLVVLTLLFSAAWLAACGSDDAEDGLADTGSDTADANSFTVDAKFCEPCEGIQPEENIEQKFHDQCAEITECTQMEAVEGAAVYCGYCGCRGTDIQCLQLIFATPGS